MKILILGASGLIGSNLFQELKRNGHYVKGTYHKKKLFKTLIRVKLSNIAKIKRVIMRIKPNVIVNCAGFSWVDGCELYKLRGKNENWIYPKKIAAFANSKQIRFIHLSTSYIFNGNKKLYSENDMPNPISTYGKYKQHAERDILKINKNNVIVRTMGVVGLEKNEKNFLYTVLNSVKNGIPLKVANDQHGNLTNAKDLAAGICKIIEQKKSGIFHLAGDNPLLSRYEAALKICKNYNLNKELIIPTLTRKLCQAAKRPKFGGLKISKAKNLLTWRPSKNLPSLSQIRAIRLKEVLF